MSSMLKLPAWSFSMIEKFENCPKQAFHKYILKEKEPESPAMAEGNRLDKAIETRVVTGAPLPPEFQQYEPMAGSVARMNQADCVIYPQLKLGISRDFQPRKFFADDVWGRGALDIAIVKKRTVGSANTAVITDWKTGKNSDGKAWSNNGLQLKIFTLLLFKHFPGVEKVTAFNLWLKSNEIGTVYKYTRADEANLWREILPRVIAVEEACKKAMWPEKSGPLCGFCPVKQCKYNRS